MKSALRGAPERSLTEQLDVEAKGQARCGASDDFREGIAAFIGKRTPVFRGC
jgi:2-(1,2-epoxy-1,2-dihydrophenyl)acetyl-CoA isomerase